MKLKRSENGRKKLELRIKKISVRKICKRKVIHSRSNYIQGMKSVSLDRAKPSRERELNLIKFGDVDRACLNITGSVS